MVVGDLAFADNDMVRQHPAHRLMESTADRFLRHLEVRPGRSAAGVQLGQRLLNKVQRRSSRIRLEVGTSPIPLQRIAPLRNLPLELGFAQHCRLGQD